MGPFISLCFCFSLSRLLSDSSHSDSFSREIWEARDFDLLGNQHEVSYVMVICFDGRDFATPKFITCSLYLISFFPCFLILVFFFTTGVQLGGHVEVAWDVWLKLGRGDLNEWISLAGVLTHSTQMSKMHFLSFSSFLFFEKKTFSSPLFYLLFLTING